MVRFDPINAIFVAKKAKFTNNGGKFRPEGKIQARGENSSSRGKFRPKGKI